MPDTPSQIPPPDVLIVDDTPANLQLLAETLKEDGCRVRLARSGALGLQAAQHEPPDLVLLDIAMPGMDGYEVCTRLKADARLRDVPVIFISALSEPLDKMKAFGAGGVDYLPKPFNREEVAARVRTHLELRRQRQELQEKIAQLHALEQQRDNLTHMIIHDLRSPLGGIQGGLELLAAALPNLPAEERKWLDLALASTRDLGRMIGTLLDVTRLETSRMPLHPAPADLAEIARHGVELLGAQALARCDIDTGGAAPLPLVCDAALLVRVVSNLVGNALKFSPEETRVRVTVRTDGACATLRVTDCGPGIPAPYQARIFEKFGQGDLPHLHRKASTGLGLAFCKLAVEAHGGRIGVESAEGQGSTFWIELPRQKER